MLVLRTPMLSWAFCWKARGIVTGEQEARRVGGHRGRACQARTL